MTAKVDFKKDYKDLYLPKTKPVLIDVPEMQFIMVDGAGDPNSEAYQQAIGITMNTWCHRSRACGGYPEVPFRSTIVKTGSGPQ